MLEDKISRVRAQQYQKTSRYLWFGLAAAVLAAAIFLQFYVIEKQNAPPEKPSESISAEVDEGILSTENLDNTNQPSPEYSAVAENQVESRDVQESSLVESLVDKILPTDEKEKATQLIPSQTDLADSESGKEEQTTSEKIVEGQTAQPATEVVEVDQVASKDDSVQPQPTIGESIDFRKEYLEKFRYYEQTVQPIIAQLNLATWAAAETDDLAESKKRATEMFSVGDYKGAAETLDNAIDTVERLEAEHAAKLDELKFAANTAFLNNQPLQASNYISEALRLSPNDSEMLALQPRANTLGEVLNLLREASIARNTNQPQKELAILKQVISLDSNRPEVKDRIASIQNNITRQRFADAIRSANRELGRENLEKAKKQYSIAKSIFPKSAEVAALDSKIKSVENEQQFSKQVALATEFAKKDNWNQSLHHFTEALKLKPNDLVTIENQKAANVIVSITNQLDMDLVLENRLADSNIANQVLGHLQDAELYLDFSPKLKQLHEKLSARLVLYEKKVEVNVISDDETHIVVVGVGIVGKTTSRTIQLRPGKHVFEGSRDGYRSVRVSVNIEPGSRPVDVTVVCSEQI